MKKLLLILISSVFALTALGATTTASSFKIGVMNLQEVIQQSPQLNTIKADLKKQFDSKEKEIVGSQKTLQDDIDNLHKNSSVMKTAERNALQDKIAKEQQQLQSMQMAFQQQYIAARDKALSSLFEHIKTIVDGIAKKQGFNLILTNEPVAYADDNLNITDEVVKAMNKD